MLRHSYQKNLIFLFLFYAALSLILDSIYFSIFLIWVFGFYIIGTLTMDNYSKWDLYACSLPVTKKQVVSAKFILLFLFLVIGCLLFSGIGVITALLHHSSISEMLISAFSTFLVTLPYFGFLMALAYKIGPERAKGFMVFPVILVGAAAFLIYKFADSQFLSQASLTITQLLESNLFSILLSVGLVIVCVLLYLIGWAVSLSIYKHKEF